MIATYQANSPERGTDKVFVKVFQMYHSNLWYVVRSWLANAQP